VGGTLAARGPEGRFVTLKRRFVPADQAAVDGIEWTLWGEEAGLPVPVAAFRVPLQPNGDAVAAVLALLRGWLVESWSGDEAKAAVRKHPGARPDVGPAREQALTAH